VCFQPLILTVGELGPADCFLHPLQFWQRLSASEMKEHRESSSNLSESSKENLSPSSHSANISSITSTFYLLGAHRTATWGWGPQRVWNSKGSLANSVQHWRRVRRVKAGGGEATATKTQLRGLWMGPHARLHDRNPDQAVQCKNMRKLYNKFKISLRWSTSLCFKRTMWSLLPWSGGLLFVCPYWWVLPHNLTINQPEHCTVHTPFSG